MADRRRLTVSKCDPVKPRSPRGKAAGESLIKAWVDKENEAAPVSVISVCSNTDKDLARRGSFAAKDVAQAGSAEKIQQILTSRGIGTVCNKGMKPESPNQDSFSLIIKERDFELYGVFDGHGPMGHFVSDIAREQLNHKFLTCPHRETDTGKAFQEMFVETQKYLESDEVTKDRKVDTSNSGSTCTMAYHNIKTSVVTIAHVGDSRAILAGSKDASCSRKSFEYIADLTVDHKPNLPEEKERIENSKPPGRVVFDGYYNHRVFAQSAMYPGLNMSRALGDVVAHKEAGLTAMPDIKVVDLKLYKEQGYKKLSLFVCSDGVWEFIESPQSIPIVMGKADNKIGCEELAKLSYKSWMDDSEGEISDDITAVVVDFDL